MSGLLSAPTTERITLWRTQDVKSLVNKQAEGLKPLAVVRVRIPTLHRWMEIESFVVEPEVPRRREEVGGKLTERPTDPTYLRAKEDAKMLRWACQVADAIDQADTNGERRLLAAEALRERGNALLREAHAGVLVGVYRYLENQVWGVTSHEEPFRGAEAELHGAGAAGMRADGVEPGDVLRTG